MRRFSVVLCAALFVIALFSQALTAQKKTFDVTLIDIPGGRVLSVGFYGKLPPPATVDKIVRDSLDSAIAIDSTKQIVATAFLGDDTLTERQYSGALVYRATDKKIVTFSEYSGTTTSSTPNYFVSIEENKTVVKPLRRWLSVEIVYPKKPTQEVAYAAIIAEIQKLVSRGLDVNAYVNVGDQKVKSTWQQVRDTDGASIFGDYSAATKKVVRKTKVLKQF